MTYDQLHLHSIVRNIKYSYQNWCSVLRDFFHLFLFYFMLILIIKYDFIRKDIKSVGRNCITPLDFSAKAK